MSGHSRKPGFNEAFFIAKSEERFYTSFNVVATLNRPLDRPRLSCALQAMVKRIRWLTYNFYNTTDGATTNYRQDYEVRYVTQIQFDDVVKFDPLREINEGLFEFLNDVEIPMGATDKPLWRINVINNNQTVCVSLCHSLADGNVALQLQRDLVHELNRLESKNAAFVDTLFDYNTQKEDLPPIHPAIEDACDLYIPSFWQRTTMKLLYYIPQLKRLYETAVEPSLFESVPVEKDLSSKFKMLHFSPEKTAALVSFCRKNGFTLTALFNVVGIQCIENNIYPFYGKRFSSSHFLAVSGRRYYQNQPGTPFQYGMMVCGAPIVFPPLSGNLIHDCQKFNNIIKEQISSREGFKNYWAFSYVDLSAQQKKAIGGKKRYTTMVSNIGKVVNSLSDDWKIIDAYFGLTCATGYHFIFNMVSTDVNGLNLVMPYLPYYDTLKAADGAPVMSHFVKEFENVCEDLVSEERVE